MKLAEQYLSMFESAEFKISTKQQRVIDFVNQQINLDLNQYVETKYSNRKYFNIDLDRMPELKQRALKSLAATNGKAVFKLADNGGMGTAVYAL